MPWRIATVLDALNRFIPQARPQRALMRADISDSSYGIASLLQDDERTELRRLCEEIDRFSQTFRQTERERYGR